MATGIEQAGALIPPLDRIDHIHVYVANRERAERWYRDVLGLAREPVLESWAADGGPLTLSNAAGTVHLALFERPPQLCRSTVALAVGAEAFIAWRIHLSRAMGRAPELQDHQLSWSIYFSDPDGNPYEITSYEYAALEPELRREGH
jgi:catechol 2,3-dioxygenase-like lactoylglutathione lyase family enzyme